MPPSNVTRAWVEDRLDAIYPVHMEAFARLLIALRKEFDRDLDTVLILAMIACGTRGEKWREALLSGETRVTSSSSVNATSLAYITGIPRETVRRKLSLLLEKGWIERDHRGDWTVSPGAATDLQPATHATITYIKAILNAAFGAETQGQVRQAPLAVKDD